MDETTFLLVDGCIDELHDLAQELRVNLDDNNVELVVHVTHAEVGDVPVSCQYYFVDHRVRTLFWLHKNSEATKNVLSGLQGIYDPSHIGASCGTYMPRR
jgi:hypothetical protein